MRAAIFMGAGRPLVVEEVADPQPGYGEAIIEVCRCGVCGSDLNMTCGGIMDYPAGAILGHEYAGTVVSLGAGATRLKVGDRVTSIPAVGCGKCALCVSGYGVACPQMEGRLGGFGQYLRAPESCAIVLPQSLSMADGALVEPLAVGRHAARIAGLKLGARVLVIGPGSVGLTIIYWARLLRAGRIVAGARSDRRRAAAMEMGADAHVLLGEDDGARIAAALGGPPDLVFECAGAPGVLQKCIDLVAPGGTVVSLGLCNLPDAITPVLAAWKRVTLKFPMAYRLLDFEEAAKALDKGHVSPRSMVTETVGLDELPARFEALRSGSDVVKLHIDPRNS